MSRHPVKPVTVSAYVPAPPEAVLEFVADTRNDPLWCPNVETVELVTGNGGAVGSRYEFHQHLDQPGGRRVQFDVETEIVARDERSVTWLVTDRFQERTIRISVEPRDRGTRITQTTQASFHTNPGIRRWAYPMLARRTLKDQFRHLADHFAA